MKKQRAVEKVKLGKDVNMSSYFKPELFLMFIMWVECRNVTTKNFDRALVHITGKFIASADLVDKDEGCCLNDLHRTFKLFTKSSRVASLVASKNL